MVAFQTLTGQIIILQKCKVGLDAGCVVSPIGWTIDHRLTVYDGYTLDWNRRVGPCRDGGVPEGDEIVARETRCDRWLIGDVFEEVGRVRLRLNRCEERGYEIGSVQRH